MSKSSKAIAQRNKHTPAKGADDRIMAGSPKNAAPQSPATPERRFPRIVVLALCLLLAAAGTWAVMEFVVWNKLPSDLVGKWIATGKQVATLEFSRNGTMVGRFNVEGKLHVVEARVAVENQTLFITTRDTQGKNELTTKQTIKSLNSNELVLQDELKIITRFQRAGE
jgi:hypothetical protein